MPAQAQNKASAQNFLDIYDITNNLVILKNGTTSLILKVSAMNFGLLAEEEQDAIIYTYAALLNSLNYPIQIVIQSQTKDVTNYLSLLKQKEAESASHQKKDRIARYRNFVASLVQERNVLDKNFYVAVPATPAELGLITTENIIPGKTDFNIKKFEKPLIVDKALSILEPRRDHLISQFARIGLRAQRLSTQEIIKVFYTSYNPEASEGFGGTNSEEYQTALVQAKVMKNQPATAKASDSRQQQPVSQPSQSPGQSSGQQKNQSTTLNDSGLNDSGSTKQTAQQNRQPQPQAQQPQAQQSASEQQGSQQNQTKSQTQQQPTQEQEPQPSQQQQTQQQQVKQQQRVKQQPTQPVAQPEANKQAEQQIMPKPTQLKQPKDTAQTADNKAQGTKSTAQVQPTQQAAQPAQPMQPAAQTESSRQPTQKPKPSQKPQQTQFQESIDDFQYETPKTVSSDQSQTSQANNSSGQNKKNKQIQSSVDNALKEIKDLDSKTLEQNQGQAQNQNQKQSQAQTQEQTPTVKQKSQTNKTQTPPPIPEIK